MERHSRTRYTTEEVLQLVIEPGVDSELSDLEGSDDDEDERLPDKVLPNEILPGEILPDETLPDDILEEEELGEDDGDEQVLEEDRQNKATEPAKKSKKKSKKVKQPEQIFKWKKKRPPAIDIEFTGDGFNLPPDDAEVLTPLQYFKMFWGDELTSLLAEQTNLYSVQKSGTSIGTTSNEIEQFLGMQMLMSVVKLPSYTMFWAAETRYPPIADVMPVNRYKKLRQFLHVSDSTLADDGENKGNRLYKVQPVLEHVRNNCVKIQPEVENSIDEQIIPAKTRYSGIRQYNPRKPVKWGFKNFVRAGKSGMMYDFFLYTGASTATQKCTGEYVVLRLCETLPKNQNYKLFFDNWFSSLALCIKLKETGILATGTLRTDRLKKCPLPSDNVLMKEGRGTSTYQCDTNSSLAVLKWYDNKCVHLCSNYSNPCAISTVQRWDKVQRKHVKIDCPNTVKEYNESMGGVDLADMLISLYRTSIKTRRWYLKVLFHCLDIAKVNAWLLYRRQQDQLNVPKKQQLTLLKFITTIAQSLVNAGKIPNSVGRPRKRKASGTPSPVSRKQPAPVPCDDARYDNVGHWPEYRPKKNKCRLCKLNFSRVYCKKCNLCLCLNNTRNCFLDFHVK